MYYRLAQSFENVFKQLVCTGYNNNDTSATEWRRESLRVGGSVCLGQHWSQGLAA